MENLEGKSDIGALEAVPRPQAEVPAPQENPVAVKTSETAIAGKLEEEKSRLNAVKEKLGLNPESESTPAISALEKQLLEIRAENLQREKEKIFAEYLSVILEELKRVIESELKRQNSGMEKTALSAADLENLSRVMHEGLSLLNKVAEIAPSILSKFDSILTEEAERRLTDNAGKKSETAAESTSELAEPVGEAPGQSTASAVSAA
jgi:hypothetical protein